MAKGPASFRSIVLGGILPVVIFTFVEQYYGTLAGLICGMVFGIGEICFEKFRHGKVDSIIWLGNGVLLVLGGVSLFTGTGIWFKLQPAIMEFLMALLLIGSVFIGKPFMTLMAKKQNLFKDVSDEVRIIMERRMNGLTFRIGIFFGVHAVIATWAAFYWSTNAWALLKGVGFTTSLFVYMGVEILWMRYSNRRPRPIAVFLVALGLCSTGAAQIEDLGKSLSVLQDRLNQNLVTDTSGKSLGLAVHLDAYLEYLIRSKGQMPKTGDEPSSWAVMIENGNPLVKYMYSVVPKSEGKKIKKLLREFTGVALDQFQMGEGVKREDFLYGGRFFLLNLLLTEAALDKSKEKRQDLGKAWCILCHFDQNFYPVASKTPPAKTPDFRLAVPPPKDASKEVSEETLRVGEAKVESPKVATPPPAPAPEPIVELPNATERVVTPSGFAAGSAEPVKKDEPKAEAPPSAPSVEKDLKAVGGDIPDIEAEFGEPVAEPPTKTAEDRKPTGNGVEP